MRVFLNKAGDDWVEHLLWHSVKCKSTNLETRLYQILLKIFVKKILETLALTPNGGSEMVQKQPGDEGDECRHPARTGTGRRHRLGFPGAGGQL